MIYSKVHNMKRTHLSRCEDQRSQDYNKSVQDRLEGNSFLKREVPLQRFFNVGHCTHASDDLSGFSKGKKISAGMNITDYDTLELAIFIQEDHWIDKKVSPAERNCLSEHCESDDIIISGRDLDMNSNNDSNLGTMKAMSFNSNVSDCASQHPFVMDATMELDSGDKISVYHPTRERTTLREAFRKETERSFNDLQTNSYLGTIDSRMEFHCPNRLQLPDATSMSRPEVRNSQSLTGPSKRQIDYPQETSSYAIDSLSGPTSCDGPAKTSTRASNESIDSIGSSTRSFSFPKLQVEWTGSPVRMPEVHVNQENTINNSQSRKHHWWRIWLPCCCK